MHYYRIRELTGKWEAENGKRLPFKDLAARTGISTPVITRMASTDGYVTNTRYIEALCRFFGVGPEQMIVFRPAISPEGMDEVDIKSLDELGRQEQS